MSGTSEWMKRNADSAQAPPGIDTSVAHSARVWNYWLGGKDNFEADRAAGEMVLGVFPGMVHAARQTRALIGRAVRFLVTDMNVRQFLDIGTGLPTADNTHEIAQRVDPSCRIVYVDNDPLVLTHAQVLLTSTPDGATAYVQADLREPEKIIRYAQETLDFSKPIAIMLMGVMGHVEDHDEARSIIRKLLEGVPSGSLLTLSDGTSTSDAVVESHRRYNESGAVPYHLRSPEEIAQLFEGLELVEPGVVPITDWRRDPDGEEPPQVDGYCGMGRKP